MDNNDIEWWHEVESEKERFIDSLIVGKTAAEVDNFEMTDNFKDHARHFYRISKLGRRSNPMNIEEAYLKSIINDESDKDLLEQELEYINNVPDTGNDKGEMPVNSINESDADDNVDDELIRIAAEHCL